MEEHRKFLADRLLSDEQPITYRLLSRAFDVHVNTAKEMLYDFLNYQNGIKENSIHATYLLYGQKKAQETKEDGDVEMGSSQPEQDSYSDPVVTETLSLVAEESLQAILDGYEKVTSINVYSLAPHPQKDLSLLSDLSRSVAEYSAKEDPLESGRKYGTITNPNVRRRDRSGKPKLAAPAASKSVKKEAPPAKPVKAEPPAAAKPTQAAKIKSEATEAASKDSTPTSSAGKPASGASTPSLKRGGSGGIMQSFAKASSKPQKPKPAAKKKEEDTEMALSDDGEADVADLPASKKKSEEEVESLRKAKKDREAQLRKMMEDDDEEEEAEEKEEEDQDEQDEEMADAPEEEPEPEPAEVKKEPEGPAEVVASSGDGRRRGKRRVTKKKRILDDAGYMVTINEEGWESFSEEDKPPPAKKQTPNPTPASSAPKAKKPAGKPGQGNIMSFFGKK